MRTETGRRNGDQSIQDALSNVRAACTVGELFIFASHDGIRTAYLVIPHDSEGTMLEDVCKEPRLGQTPQ